MATIKSFLPNRCLVVLAATVVLSACGSSRQRNEGIQELQKLQAGVHALHILVSAGVTKPEYSQRFEDALVKLGDLDQSAAETVPKFPRSNQPTVKLVYAHLSQAMAAYKNARDYFGDNFDGDGCEQGCSVFRESDYDAIKQEFPSIAHLDFGPEFTWYKDKDGNVVNHSYRRSDMLQALWVVAGAEDDQARQLIQQLSQE
ncbi:MAG: hypothetical protein WB680_15435 [Candidatus Acidiferrales bacterium]